MRSYYMYIKSNTDFTAQRINYVRVKAPVVKGFGLICIVSCILFHVKASEIIEKETNLQVRTEKREIVHDQINVLPLESENDNKTILISRQAKNTDDSEHEKRDNETCSLEKERLRLRRNEGKDERPQKSIKRQKKHKTNRRRKSNVKVAKFDGAIPEVHIENEVLIGPWMKSTEMNDSKFDFTNFHLVEGKKAIEVNKSGLYYIIVQIAYTGNSAPNSYWIVLNSEGDSDERKLAVCITNSTDSTCSTSTFQYLRKKDRIGIQQREKNRSINLRTGLSFVVMTCYR